MLRRMVLMVGLLVLIALEVESADLFNKKWSVNTHAVSSLQISKDGTKILTNNGTETIIYDLQTGNTLKIFEGKGQFSEDGLYILTTQLTLDSMNENKYKIDVYKLNNYEFIKSILYPKKVPNVAFYDNYHLFSSPKGNQLLLNYNTTLHFIDFETGKILMDTNAFENRFEPTLYSVNWIQYSYDGSKLFVGRVSSLKGNVDGAIVSFNTTTFVRGYESGGFKKEISLVGENDILSFANVTDKETACTIYDTKNHIKLKKILGNGGDVTHLNLSHDLKYLEFMKIGEIFKILSFPDLQPVKEIVMPYYDFPSVFSKDGKYYAMSYDNKIDLYEIGTIGVEEKENNLEIIYPNPTTDEINLSKLELKSGDLKIIITDLNGKEIKILFNGQYEQKI